MEEEPKYLTTEEAAAICRYKTPDPIRRFIHRGELPAVRIYPKRLLIPAKEFWAWFNSKQVQHKELKPVEVPPEIVFVPAKGKGQAHFKINKKEALAT